MAVKRKRIIGPHNPSPILLTGLWKQLSKAQRSRLSKLGFDEQTWNNNVKERTEQPDLFDIYVSGEFAPQRYEIMVGDRARTRMPPSSAYEMGMNL